MPTSFLVLLRMASSPYHHLSPPPFARFIFFAWGGADHRPFLDSWTATSKLAASKGLPIYFGKVDCDAGEPALFLCSVRFGLEKGNEALTLFRDQRLFTFHDNPTPPMLLRFATSG